MSLFENDQPSVIIRVKLQNLIKKSELLSLNVIQNKIIMWIQLCCLSMVVIERLCQIVPMLWDSAKSFKKYRIE